jgi:branched-chain amino acid transport system permease protein
MKLIFRDIIEKGLHPKIYFPFLLVVLMAILPLVPQNPFYEDIIVSSFFYGAMALAWNLVGGFAGQISLGHTAFLESGPMPQPSYTSIMPCPPGWGCWPGRSSLCWWPLVLGFPASG